VARLGCALHRLLGGKRIYVCYQVHSFYFNTLTGFKRALFLWLEIILSRLSDILLFQNQYELDQGKRYGMDRRALLLNIGNGINLAELAPRRRVRAMPDWRGGREPFTIICVARVEPKKNHPLLIDAALALRNKLAARYGPAGALKVLCIGEIGEERVPRYAAEKGLGDTVEFTGLKDRAETARLLDLGHCAVLSSSAEGKPRSLMEAMNMGLPCVATEVCGTADVVDHGVTGFLVPYNDAEALADALEKLMEDPESYRRFSAHAIEKAKREFDEDKVIEKLAALYREQPRKNPA
jgi:glycosyltransferase involved in cell wall biosynthesis